MGGKYFRTKSQYQEPKKEEKQPEKIIIDTSKYMKYRRNGSASH